MMLMHRVHRLPVVDDKKKPIGIVTRTDIFEPLIAKRDDLLQDQAERRCDDDDERDDRLSVDIRETPRDPRLRPDDREPARFKAPQRG